MRREYRIVLTERAIGAVRIDDDGLPHFEGAATDVLRGRRQRLGDTVVAEEIIRNGWSNGYVYFAEPTP